MKKGLLLPIFSLPSKYGIGDFGNEAYEFVNILRDNHIDYWEILPINAGSQRPYSPTSFYALDRDYLSIDKLIEMGLLNFDEVKTKKKQFRITYDNYKMRYYKMAFDRFVPNEEYYKFADKKEIQEYVKYIHQKYGEDEDLNLFLQYILDKQYMELKKYANDNGVKIIGDMPIYPDRYSSDVEYNKEWYQFENGKLTFVSGAPPDYYNVDGQKWNTPLYDFNALKNDRYKYLLSRYKEFLYRYDIVRIDHFKAFEAYYKIPIDKTGRYGYYEEGPKDDFFEELFKFSTPDRFIVEDLGNINQETERLRDKYNFMGTKVLQFTLSLTEPKDEFNDRTNMCVFTGNHDTNTLVGWYNSLKKSEIANIITFLKNQNCYNGSFHESIVKYALKSLGDVVIIPVQDVIGLDENSRINIPGKELYNNWSWELLNFDDLKKHINIME